MEFKVGDRVFHITDQEFGTVVAVNRHAPVEVAFEPSGYGYYHKSGAGFYGKDSDEQIIRLITPLEQLL